MQGAWGNAALQPWCRMLTVLGINPLIVLPEGRGAVAADDLVELFPAAERADLTFYESIKDEFI